MSTESDVYRQFVTVLVEQFGYQEADIGPDVYLLDLDLDSVSTVGVVDVLEKLLGVPVDEASFGVDRTLGEIVEALEKDAGLRA